MSQQIGSTSRSSAHSSPHVGSSANELLTKSSRPGGDEFVKPFVEPVGGFFPGFHGLGFLSRVSDWLQTAKQGSFRDGANIFYGQLAKDMAKKNIADGQQTGRYTADF